MHLSSVVFCLIYISVVLTPVSGDGTDILRPEILRPYMFKDEISGNLDVLIPSTASSPNQGYDEYTIRMESTRQQILPDAFPKTRIFAYGGLTKDGVVFSFPGPSILAKHKVPTRIRWVNNVYGPHILPVDYNYPFNSSSVFRNEIPLVPHVHGIVAKSSSDGQPNAYWTAMGSRGRKYHTADSC